MKAFLLDSELVKKEDIKKAETEAKKSGKKIDDVLLAWGKINEEELARLKAYILGIPFVNLEGEKIDAKVLAVIPEPIAKKHNIVSFKKNGSNLEVAMLDPEDLVTIEFIKKTADFKIFPRLTNVASMKYVLSQYQKSLAAEFGEIIKVDSETLATVLKEPGDEVDVEDLKKTAEDLPIVRIVDTLIRHAILQRSSDIHIEPTEKEVLVRYRIDGILHNAMVLPKQVTSGIVARIKVLANLKLDEHRLPQDGRFKIETTEYKYSLRVSILPVFDGEKVVMRLLPENAKGFTLEDLGFHGEALEALYKNIKKPLGMILATGPTGSGKTTTLYTILSLLNLPGVNISTIEDPVEYRMPRVNQTQVRPDIGLSFATGLRSLVRQDPDIIMVGEIRDTETANLAINAALTGHLVLSSLHTNSAAGSLPRLLDMKVEPFLIVSTTNAIIAQRLVRKLCGEPEKHILTEAEIKKLGEHVDLERVLEFLKKEKIVSLKAVWKDIPFFRPKLTAECQDGYSDRIGIHEVLEMTPTIKDLLMKSATSDQIEEQAKKEGMMTMVEDGITKCVQGLTTIEEVFRVTME
ncbi:MAG: Type II secretion system protein E [Candidatus Giovannonibacteria bacterium GW2011_GWA1_43_15]|uniref:Type II secretion system protein E n=1 Tax=Candidatus Giovannonibacteria bacterium GW2011_GWA2_44_26 TaxID=1618648 RepID=A0A0G1L5D4_9BACT|nr:MAG: Type II secretion system protein E [Candidatus Giovannonibacteria bacterium GW2011_GWB1_43_13]KKS99762.1 MAG: Type II secretion system protein E [Candidatus Giovannonibacteria bacterium GW2011_GWA1_43_15]KKT20705.1 MAG: Type II secretion system protein E [Candidatus Giovannonibacteria bacterium GW2011_GWC2_43_8]KKT63847.1 MAG: Type II secretion system protein E [Candidatus Giovannonibacteria bacterium GW2011_GWA2_44_26]